MSMCMTKPLTLTTAIRTIIAVAGIATLRRAQGPIASNMTITIIAGVADMAAVAKCAMYTR
jgi:hypothetical protein